MVTHDKNQSHRIELGQGKGRSHDDERVDFTLYGKMRRFSYETALVKQSAQAGVALNTRENNGVEITAYRTIYLTTGKIVQTCDDISDAALAEAMDVAQVCRENDWRLRSIAQRAEVIYAAEDLMRRNRDRLASSRHW